MTALWLHGLHEAAASRIQGWLLSGEAPQDRGQGYPGPQVPAGAPLAKPDRKPVGRGAWETGPTGSEQVGMAQGPRFGPSSGSSLASNLSLKPRSAIPECTGLAGERDPAEPVVLERPLASPRSLLTPASVTASSRFCPDHWEPEGLAGGSLTWSPPQASIRSKLKGREHRLSPSTISEGGTSPPF